MRAYSYSLRSVDFVCHSRHGGRHGLNKPFTSDHHWLTGLFCLLLFYSFPGFLEANDIQLSGLSQSPTDPVAVGTPITYNLTTRNVDDGINDPSSIGISIRMRVDGTVIRADSGEIAAA